MGSQVEAEPQAVADVPAAVEVGGAGPAALSGPALSRLVATAFDRRGTPSLMPGGSWRQIAALQRTAGNAAVTRMLARDPAPDATAPAATGDVQQRLMSGAFDDSGDYKPDGTGFAAGDLDGLLKQTGSAWGGGIDTAAPPTGQSADGQPSGGDSAGKSVAEHPPWVAAFQNKLIGVLGTWSPDDKVAQRLMQVFLRAWTRKRNAGTMAANVAVFYQYAGAHEENAASQGLGTAGAKGVEQSNWCQQASTYAVCEALLRNGLRFKSPPGQETKERLGTSRINEVGKQAGRYEKWLNSDPKGRMAWGGDACFASALSPGDVVSFYSAAHGPTSTGHVVTLVTGAAPGEEAALTVVSGNAGGEAARVEEVQRVKPPAGLFSGSAKRPSGSKDVFIWSLQRSSLLNAVIGIANSDQQFSDSEIAGAGLERCKPLDEIWPASEAVPSTGSGGGATAPAGGGTPAGGGATTGGGAAPGETPGAAGMPAPGASAPSAEPSVPAPAQPPEPASGGGWASGEQPAPGGGGWSSGGAQAPGEPTSAGDGGLGEWFESLWESVFSEPGTDAGPATGEGPSAGVADGGSSSGGAATGSPGSEWFTDW